MLELVASSWWVVHALGRDVLFPFKPMKRTVSLGVSMSQVADPVRPTASTLAEVSLSSRLGEATAQCDVSAQESGEMSTLARGTHR
jgi:hypothetical protein